MEVETKRWVLDEVLSCSGAAAYQVFAFLTPDAALAKTQYGVRAVDNTPTRLAVNSPSAPDFCRRAQLLVGANNRISGYQVAAFQSDSLDVADVLEQADRFDFSSRRIPGTQRVYFIATGDQRQNSFDFPETLVRFGLTSTTELRIGAPDYFENFNAGAGFGSGWGDFSLGVTQQLIAHPDGFDASLVVALSIPTGAGVLTSHGYDPQFLLLWSHPISKNWTAAGMFSLLWPTEGPRRNLTGQASFLFDRQITSKLDAFVEYGGENPQRGGPVHIIHVGGSHKVRSNQQVDFHFGFGLSAAAPDHFIGFGYSFQRDALHRQKHGGS